MLRFTVMIYFYRFGVFIKCFIEIAERLATYFTKLTKRSFDNEERPAVSDGDHTQRALLVFLSLSRWVSSRWRSRLFSASASAAWHRSASCSAPASRVRAETASASAASRPCRSCSSRPAAAAASSAFTAPSCPLYWTTVWVSASSLSRRSRRASCRRSVSASRSSSRRPSSWAAAARARSSSPRAADSSSWSDAVCWRRSFSRSLASVSWDSAWRDRRRERVFLF